MPAKKSIKPYIHYHKDGSVRAKGKIAGETMEGHWEWFRKDGTKMRSGFFNNGKQVGTWTTYDRTGKVVKTTEMKTK
jgi:antitoxin component YwqK of YwqJK toxin-antitoxin module